jgi:hypothetical protein
MSSDQPTSIWSKRVPEYLGYAEGLRGIQVPSRLSLPEAACLFDLWKETGIFAHSKAPPYFNYVVRLTLHRGERRVIP